MNKDQLKDFFRETAERIRNGYGGNADDLGGVELDVEVAGDYDSTPDEFDCYSDNDKAGHRNGDWEFVNITLKILVEGIEVGQAGVGSVEHGLTEKDEDEITYLAEEILPSLLAEAAESLPTSLQRIESGIAGLRELVGQL